MMSILQREPLGYEIVSQRGSHRKLESRNGYPPLMFSYHDKATVPPGVVRKILVVDAGLDEDDAAGLT